MLADYSHGGPSTWSRLREATGCDQRKTRRCGYIWRRSMYSSRHLSAEMLTMIDQKVYESV